MYISDILHATSPVHPSVCVHGSCSVQLTLSVLDSHGGKYCRSVFITYWISNEVTESRGWSKFFWMGAAKGKLGRFTRFDPNWEPLCPPSGALGHLGSLGGGGGHDPLGRPLDQSLELVPCVWYRCNPGFPVRNCSQAVSYLYCLQTDKALV